MLARVAPWLASLALASCAGCAGRGERARSVDDEPAPARPARRPICSEPISVPPALAGADGGYATAAVPRGREIKPGLHGLKIVFRADGLPPHAAVDFTQITCTVRTDPHRGASPPRCKATPTGRRDHSTTEGSWHAVADDTAARVRACFATNVRAPSRSDLVHVEHIGAAWTTTETNGRLLLVRTAQIAPVPKVETYGCEGVHDQPCDRATRPIGGTIDATQRMDVALYALDRQGLHPLRGAFAPTAVDLPLLYFVVEVKGAYSDREVAPELEVPGFHPLDANYLSYDGDPSRMACYYPALTARLAALALDPAEHVAQMAVLYDQTVLSFLQHDAASARDHLAQLRATLDSARGDASPDIQQLIIARLADLDALAAGTLSIDDPCSPP